MTSRPIEPASASGAQCADLPPTTSALAAVVPSDPLSLTFLIQAGVNPAGSVADARLALRNAGDRMLAAVLFHSDHLELSEQFDKDTAFEKSVHNLTWSYAAFLSAVRARNR